MIKEENFGYRDKRGHFVPKAVSYTHLRAHET